MEGARRTEVADVAALVALESEARRLAGEQRGGAVWSALHPPRGEAVATLLDDRGSHIVVGTIDEAVVGYAVAELVVGHDGTRLVQIHDLFVLPDARGVGVGAALLEALVSWAREVGATGIGSTALPGDRSTKNFFESFGMVARAISVHRDLHDDASEGASP